MNHINSYDQYLEILDGFKKREGRSSTNKLMMPDEVKDLIEAGKLLYAEEEHVLWLYIDEGDYYSASFYVPADQPVKMHGQDKDVIVDLMGNQTRNNDQWERELIDTGFEKSDKRFEYGCRLDDIIDEAKIQYNVASKFWGRRGFYQRKAVKEDYPELKKLLETALGRSRHVVTVMTDYELDEMENSGTCDVICDSSGKIQAASFYKKRNTTALGCWSATYYQRSGLGALVVYCTLINAYEKGCKKLSGWIREDNQDSLALNGRTTRPTGKYYWQFVFRATEQEIIS